MAQSANPASADARMQQIAVFINEQDHWQHRPLYLAILELARDEKMAGATVLKGVAGYSAEQAIHSGGLVEVAANLPLVVLIVDEAARVDRLLPRLEELIAVGGGMITVSDVAAHVYRRPGRPARATPPAHRVAEIMQRDVVSVPPDMPVDQLLTLLLNKYYSAVPVVDAERHVLGMVTEGDLLNKPGLGLRLSVLEELQERGGAAFTDLTAALHASGKTARDLMGVRPQAVIGPDATLEDAARRMTRYSVKRLPVLDSERRLLGVVSRLDLLRSADDIAAARSAMPGKVHGTTVGEVMIKTVPTVFPDASLDEVSRAFRGEGATRRVVVIDNATDRHVVGIITETNLVQKMAPPEKPGLFQSLLEGLQVLGPSAGAPIAVLPPLESGRASDIMSQPVRTVAPSTPLRDAIGILVAGAIKALPVVDEQNRLLGLVDRRRLLQALIGDA